MATGSTIQDQVQSQLNIQIDGLVSKIGEIKKVPTQLDITKYFLTNRQISKKLLTLTGEVDDDDAHYIIYGTDKIYDNGVLLDNEIKYPACVNSGTCMSTGSSIEKVVQDKKTEMKNTFNQFYIKVRDLIKEIAQIVLQILQGIVAMVSAATILPFGSGVPVALGILKGIITSIKNLETKIFEFIPILTPLTSIAFVLTKDNPIIAAISATIALLSGAVGSTKGLGDLMPAKILAQATSSDTTDTSLTSTSSTSTIDTTTTTSTIEVNITATKTSVQKGKSTKLTAVAKGGNWLYSYNWSTDDNTFTSNRKEVNVTPLRKTTYYVKVTDGNGSSALNDITISIEI